MSLAEVKSRESVVIVAPYWRHHGQVGNYRVDRFARWLFDAGYRVVMVRAGRTDVVTETESGCEITIRDPLNLYPEDAAAPPGERARRPNRLRRWAAFFLLKPDPLILWNRRVARSQLVDEHAGRVVCVLSSSPPESVHLSALALAREFKAALCVDMRDGWLDEPLKPLLQTSAFQRWREGRLEKRVLRAARHIMVTSDLWKEALEARCPHARGKIVTLTNAYPREAPVQELRAAVEGPINLLHAGRFTMSRASQTPSHLLHALHSAVKAVSRPGHILLLGELNEYDRSDAGNWNDRFMAHNWNMSFEPSVPREEMIARLQSSDGLLLLSASRCVIPSKLFEYISVRRPVLVVTQRDSATWRVAQDAPQMFCVDYESPGESKEAARFLEACASGVYDTDIPDAYSEAHLKSVFLNKVIKTVAPGATVQG